MVHGISKALVMFDDNFKSTLKTEKLTTETLGRLKEKTWKKKARRSFNSLKDNFFLNINCYNIKCVSLMF